MNTNLHDNRHTPDTLVVIDTYDWYENDRKESEQTDALNEAMLLTSMANTHGLRVDFETITNDKDRERINSYKRMRHNIHLMNGSRPTELIEVIMDLVDRVNYERPEKVIVVGENEAFQLLCSAAEQNNAHVQIWTSNPKIPPKLRRYEIHPLELVYPPVYKTKPTVVVRLDVENHLITLHKRGCSPDTQTYLEAIRKTINDLGNIINIQAWADWESLRRSLGKDYQREFEQNGVKTFYQINQPGKSTSDMAMVGSIHESLDHDNGLDIYVIGTGDADFTPVVESIRNQGKKAVVLTLEGSLGNKLKKAADEVRFLDIHFNLKITDSTSTLINWGESNKALVATLVVAHIQRTRHWQYVYINRLPDWLAMDWIKDAVATGLLIHRNPSDPNSVEINKDNPMTQQAVYFEKWVQRQIHYYLVNRKFDWVDTSFLVRGMQKDRGCKELGIGQDRKSAIIMLDASKDARLVIKKTIKNPNLRHTWLLPKPTTEQHQTNQRVETGANNPTPDKKRDDIKEKQNTEVVDEPKNELKQPSAF